MIFVGVDWAEAHHHTFVQDEELRRSKAECCLANSFASCAVAQVNVNVPCLMGPGRELNELTSGGAFRPPQQKQVLPKGENGDCPIPDRDRTPPGHPALGVGADALGVHTEQTNEIPGMVGGSEDMGIQSRATQRGHHGETPGGHGRWAPVVTHGLAGEDLGRRRPGRIGLGD